jgi:hypothetical protein
MNGNGFLKKVLAHSVAARARWSKHMEDKPASLPIWNQVLTEEVGKLNRCCNKLALAEDPRIVEQWETEAKHRLVTIASICTRFYEAFDNSPRH